MRKLMSLALALVMSLALAAPAAAAEVGTSGNAGSVPVTISADATTFNVSIPTGIPVNIDAKADVTCPNNLSITNYSAGAVQVTNIQMKDAGWTLANYNNGDRALLAAEKVDAKKIGFAITPVGGTLSATSIDGTQNLTIDANEWTIAGDGKSLGFTCDAIASAVSSAITTAVHAVDVVFTVGWATGNAGGGSENLSAPGATFNDDANGDADGIEGDVLLTWEELKDSANGTIYDYDAGFISDTEMSDSFLYNESLIGITLPDSMTSIGPSAFFYCTSLASITIPDSITSIGTGAFFYCSSLTTVNYTGTEEQWNAITIGSSNDSLTSATINYNYVA